MSIQLEADRADDRLAALREIVLENRDSILDIAPSEEVNNHVHTHYSFSPYSPTSVAYHARRSGLQAVGSVDHDSIGAAEELIEAARIVGIGSTVGCELRVSFADTPFATRRLNNPDTEGNAYIVLHGVPRDRIGELRRVLRPIHAARNARNVAQVEKLNEILGELGLEPLDFETDVVPLSWADREGSITERHILYALAGRLEEEFGRGDRLIRFIEESLQLTLSERARRYLSDEENPHFTYDLLGVLKSNLLPRFFIQPGIDECPSVTEVTSLGLHLGAIPAYAYLGDVGESPTGDKAAQAFEDAYLDELFYALPELGFRAVTYMPPRNTREQLRRVKRLAQERDLLEISGVDINSSRQVFTCPEVNSPDFRHLNTSTWALIAHEKLSTMDARYGLFHGENPFSLRSLSERVELYAGIARRSDPHYPESMFELAPLL